MDKQDYIAYWRTSSEKSWTAAIRLFEKSDYVESLFFAHLIIEKLLKAHWVKDNSDNFPPRIHNVRLLAEQTNLTKYTPIETHTFPTDYFETGDPFIEEIKKTGIELEIIEVEPTQS